MKEKKEHVKIASRDLYLTKKGIILQSQHWRSRLLPVQVAQCTEKKLYHVISQHLQPRNGLGNFLLSGSSESGFPASDWASEALWSDDAFRFLGVCLGYLALLRKLHANPVIERVDRFDPQGKTNLSPELLCYSPHENKETILHGMHSSKTCFEHFITWQQQVAWKVLAGSPLR